MARITLTLATIFCLAFTPIAAQNFEKGMAAAEAGDFVAAYREWSPLAKEGDPEAQFYLGHLYEIGKGVPKDQAEAVKWFKLSAEQGHKEAQNYLFTMFSHGKGVLQDKVEAVKWLRMLAKQGDGEAQEILGIMHSYGEGLLQNYAKGYMWLYIASYNGQKKANEWRDKIAKKMTNYDISKAYIIANACLLSKYKLCGYETPSAAATILSSIQPKSASEQDFDMGYEAYKAGNYGVALQKWTVLADKGNVNAKFYLGRMYSNGQGVPQDYALAVKWFHLAAKQGNAESQKVLGIMYRRGEGLPQDYAKAWAWYRLSAIQGNVNAQHNLGDMYRKGYGIPVDNIIAHSWLNIASANGHSMAGERRDKLAKKMTNGNISNAHAMAKKCMSSEYKECGFTQSSKIIE